MTTGLKTPSSYYIELITTFPPRPITNDAELIATQNQINSINATEKAAIIGPVYTPLEYRKTGYVTACVAELSQLLLNQGFQNCLLFTDVMNPTSNRIYRNICYQPVGDWHDYKFKQI